MYSQGVFLQVRHPKLGSAKGSGLQINNIVITHGSILAPLCLSDKDANGVLHNYSSIEKELNNVMDHNGIEFKVLGKRMSHHVCNNPNMNNVLHTPLGEDCDLEEAKFIMLHHYKGMTNISQEITNWTMFNDICDEEELGCLLLSKLIILALGKTTKDALERSLYQIHDILNKSPIIYPGLAVVVESTPFGNFSFFNSWSCGIVSKLIGPANDGIVIDARLVTGCEGSPIYMLENGTKSTLIGIVVHTISWCNGEWVGFSLGLSIEHLVNHILGIQAVIDYIPIQHLLKSSPTTDIDLKKLRAAIVFVRSRSKWGSGVVINEDNGLILTCSHVIQCDHNAVFVLWNGNKLHATVIYASSTITPYDLALLTVGRVPGLGKLSLADTPPVLGERVLAVGYPLSTESLVSLNSSPTLSAGCVAKISYRGGPLHTTCCTQNGLSGGALVRPPNQLVGIIVSNVRSNETTMPHFSFAVNVEDFRGPVKDYIRTKDPTYLRLLCQESCALKMEWSLLDCKL